MIFKQLPASFVRAILFEMVKRNTKSTWTWESWKLVSNHCGLYETRPYGDNWKDTSPIHYEGVCINCNRKMRYPDGTRNPIEFGCGHCQFLENLIGPTFSARLHAVISFKTWSKENRIHLIRYLQHAKPDKETR